MKTATLFLVVVTLTSVCTFEIDISEEEKFERLTQSLGYGEKCSWQAEKSRQAFTRAAFRTLRKDNVPTESAFKSKVLHENEPLCSTRKMTICDEKTQRCKCGSPAREIFHPNGNDYIIEKDENGNQHCRWVEGGYCLSRDMLEVTQIAPFGHSFDLKCQEGTECLGIGGGECSIFALNLTQRYHKPSSSSLRQMSQDILKGELCTCQPVDYNKESDGNDDWTSLRKKRSILENTWD